MKAYVVLDDDFVPTSKELSVMFERSSVIYAESDADADAKKGAERHEIKRLAKERASNGYQEMISDLENGTFQPDFVPDLDTMNIPNPFEKYEESEQSPSVFAAEEAETPNDA